MDTSRKQKIAKAKFWQRIKANPTLAAPDDMTDAEIAQIAGLADLQMALKKAEFRAWFLDVDSSRALIEAGVEAAVSRLIGIVEMSGSDVIGKDAEAKASDQIRAAEILLKYAGYGPSDERKGAANAPKNVSDMSEQELDAFIKSKAKRLRKVVDAE